MFQTSFGGTLEIEQFIEDICIKGGGLFDETPEMRYFNRQLLKEFNPDVNGYSLCILVPPPFDGLKQINKFNQQFVDDLKKFTIFSALDFNPPQRQVQSEKFSARTGGIPYVTEVDISPQCSISYIDNYNLDVFNFHSIWVEYMHELILGYIDPPSIYLDPNSTMYGGLDYAGSMFVMKYEPSMQKIKYLGKATGIYPQLIPNKEILGIRTSNELTLVPITYSCAWFEETLDSSHPIWIELHELLQEYYNLI